MRKIRGLLFCVAIGVSGCTTDAKPTSAVSSVPSNGSSTESSGVDEPSTTVVFAGDKNSEFCKVASVVGGGQFDFLGPGNTPATVKLDFEKIDQAMTSMIKSAPSEIRADVVTTADVFKQFKTILAKYGFDVSKMQTNSVAGDDLQAVEKLLTSSANATASARIDAYTKQVCGPSA